LVQQQETTMNIETRELTNLDLDGVTGGMGGLLGPAIKEALDKVLNDPKTPVVTCGWLVCSDGSK